MFNQFLRSEPFTDAINDMKEEDEYGNRLQQDGRGERVPWSIIQTGGSLWTIWVENTARKVH
jgi:hypothetical protein